MKKTVIIIMMFMVSAAFLSMVPAVSAQTTGTNCLETVAGTWCAETVLSDEMKFDGVAVGDADNDGQDDVIGSGLSGKVWMASKIGGEWIARTLWTSPGELIISAVGDADNDGKNEIVVVGMVAGPEADIGAGQATMLKGSGNSWTATKLFEDSAMLHAVTIGDADPDHAGNEVVVAGFSHNMTLLTKKGANWESEYMFTAGHKIRTVVLGDVDGDNKQEIIAASKDANVYIVERSGTGWANQSIFVDTEGGEARCGVGDYDGDGKLEIVAGGDSSQFAYITRSGTTWTGNVIFKDTDKIRGAWIGDVWDGRAGEELISGGYSGQVNIHYKEGGTWKHVIIYDDGARLHHTITGDVDPDHPGLEIVVGGYSNKVTVIGQYHPDFAASMTPSGAMIKGQTEATFKITLEAKDFYTDDVTLAVEGLPTGATATLTPTKVTLSSDSAMATLKILVPATVSNGNTTFKVKATGDVGVKTVEGYLNVDRQVKPDISTAEEGQKVKKGQSVSYTFTVTNNGNFPDQFDIVATSSNGIEATPSLGKTQALQPGESVTVLVTQTIPKNQKGKEDVLTVKATSEFLNTTSDSVSITTTFKEETTGGGCGNIIVFSALLGSVSVVGIVYRKRK